MQTHLRRYTHDFRFMEESTGYTSKKNNGIKQSKDEWVADFKNQYSTWFDDIEKEFSDQNMKQFPKSKELEL